MAKQIQKYTQYIKRDAIYIEAVEMVDEYVSKLDPANPPSAFRVKARVQSIIRKYPQMRDDDAFKLSYISINAMYVYYVEFISRINEVVEYVPSKQELAAFMRISPRAYEELLNFGDDKQKQIMSTLDNYVMDMLLDSPDLKRSQARLKAIGVGHSVQTKAPEKPNTTSINISGSKDAAPNPTSMTYFLKDLQELQEASKREKENK